MKKVVYLMNEMYDLNNAIEKKEKEIITIYNNEKILLCFVNNAGEYSIYRKEKISFLDVKEEEVKISKQEYNIALNLVGNKNLDDLFIKHTFIFDNNEFFNVYGGKYQGLVTLEKFYEDDVREEDYDKVNGIDITDNDLANDLKLLNMTYDEVENEISQLRINDTNIF